MKNLSDVPPLPMCSVEGAPRYEELRMMRDAIYGKNQSQQSWNACYFYWLRDAAWLEEEYQKLVKK
jgi:hypothetical protein